MSDLANAVIPQNGDYVLSEAGEILAYKQTTTRLMSHYLQNGLKIPQPEIPARIAKLQSFLEQNFKSAEDYAEKIPELATFVGEQNVGRLGAFIGQHFFTTLDKTKTAILEKAKPLAREIHENPYRVPGNDLLLSLGDAFRKAAPMPGAVPAQTLIVDLSATESSTPTAIPTGGNTDSTNLLPGQLFLKELGEEFAKASPLSFQKTSANPLPDLSAGTDSSSSATSSPDEESVQMLPGQLFLKTLGSEFAAAPAAKLTTATGPEMPNLGAAPAIAEKTVARQVSFKEYLQLSNAVAKFMRTKDQEGYKKWYASIPVRGKIILNVNSTVQKEAKGSPVDWNAEITSLAQKTGKMQSEMKKLTEEIKAYRKVAGNLQAALQEAVKAGLPGANASALYAQLAALFENQDSVNSKSTALKMALLQVTVPAAKNLLTEKLGSLIKQCGQWYGLPDH